MSEQVLAIRDCRGNGDSPSRTVFSKAVRTPRYLFLSVVGDLVDFYPDVSGIAFEGAAACGAFSEVVHHWARVRRAPLVPDEFATSD